MGVILQYKTIPSITNNITTQNAIFTDIQKVFSGTYTSKNSFNSSYCDIANSTLTGTMPTEYSAIETATNNGSYAYFYFKKAHKNQPTMKKHYYLSANSSGGYTRLAFGKEDSKSNWSPYNTTPTGGGRITQATQVNMAPSNGITYTFFISAETLAFHVTDDQTAGAQVFWDYQDTAMDTYVKANIEPTHCPTACFAAVTHSYYNSTSVAVTSDTMQAALTTFYRPDSMAAYNTTGSSNNSYWDVNSGFNMDYGNQHNGNYWTISPAPWSPHYLGVAGADQISVMKRVGWQQNGNTVVPPIGDALNFYRIADNVGNSGDTFTVGSDTYGIIVMHKCGDGASTSNPGYANSPGNTRNACYAVKI
jgi:hypothetical protein